MENLKIYLEDLRKEALKNQKFIAFSLEFPYKTKQGFYLLPQRQSAFAVVGACKIFDQESLEKFLAFLDGKVDYIFLDSEVKNLDFTDIEIFSKNFIKKSKILTIKVNDFTSMSADLLISQLFDYVSQKKIIIVGCGNIGSKLALKLSERNADIFLTDLDFEKARIVSEAFNKIKTNKENKIKAFQIFDLNNFENADLIISFAPSNSKAITKEMIEKAKLETVIIDGGIGTIQDNAFKLNRNFLRIDIKAGFFGYIDSIIQTNNFMNNVLGKRKINNQTFVAGGLISGERDIVLDSITNPTKAIGLSDGKGSLIRETLNNVSLNEETKKIIFNPCFIFRVDGGSSGEQRPRNERGMGHITRSIILGNYLRDKGYDIYFIMKDLNGIKEVEKHNFSVFKINEEQQETDQIIKILKNLMNVYLIIDKLNLSADYVKKLKNHCKKIITIDNQGQGTIYSDLNLYPLCRAPKKLLLQNKFYIGPNLVLLRESFYSFLNREKQIKEIPETIFVSLGGTDSTKTTLKVIQALKNIKGLRFHIIIGPSFSFKEEIEKEVSNDTRFILFYSPKNFDELLYNADLAIVGGGITPYEAAFLGTPTITICHNEGELNDHSFADYNFSVNLGVTHSLDNNKLYKEILALINNYNKRRELSEKGSSLLKERPEELTLKLILKNNTL